VSGARASSAHAGDAGAWGRVRSRHRCNICLQEQAPRSPHPPRPRSCPSPAHPTQSWWTRCGRLCWRWPCCCCRPRAPRWCMLISSRSRLRQPLPLPATPLLDNPHPDPACPQYLSAATMNKKQLLAGRKSQLMQEFQRFEGDVGSSEVQGGCPRPPLHRTAHSLARSASASGAADAAAHARQPGALLCSGPPRPCLLGGGRTLAAETAPAACPARRAPVPHPSSSDSRLPDAPAVALLTDKIRSMGEHFKAHKKDYHSMRCGAAAAGPLPASCQPAASQAPACCAPAAAQRTSAGHPCLCCQTAACPPPPPRAGTHPPTHHARARAGA
jgi:ribosomal protein S15P/S13E